MRIQHGMALIAVLWLVAAMSLIISGVVRSVRSESHTAGIQRQTAIAGATADAAILLVLQKLHLAQKEMPKNLQSLPVEFGGTTHLVHVTPLNGLIDINNAPMKLIANLYQYAAELDTQTAQTLAQATVETRQRKDARSLERGFNSIQDLMRVPSMTYNLYAKVADLVTASIKSGDGRVNPLAAPYGVLLVLVDGNTALATQIITQRTTDTNTVDTSFLKPDLIDMASPNSFALQTSIALPDQTILHKEWFVFWGTDVRSDLPWRVLDTHQKITPPSHGAPN